MSVVRQGLLSHCRDPWYRAGVGFIRCGCRDHALGSARLPITRRPTRSQDCWGNSQHAPYFSTRANDMNAASTPYDPGRRAATGRNRLRLGGPVLLCGQRWPASASLPRKWSWTRRMAIEPSPTAAATRLTDPCRTSPTAKTPGKLDSRNIGRRRSGHRSSGCPPWRRSVPVTTKPD